MGVKMKWINAEKYRPIEGLQLFLLTENNGEQRLEVGHYLRHEFLYLDNIRVCNVTHFCIPDAIEIEE
jgi:hypothetical protein